MNLANPLLWLLFLGAWPVLPLTVPFAASELALKPPLPRGLACGHACGSLTRDDLAQLLVAGLASTPLLMLAAAGGLPRPLRPAARRA